MDYRLFKIINGAAGHYGWLDSLGFYIAHYGAIVFPLALVYLWFRRGDVSAKQADYRAALLALVSLGIALAAAQVIGHFYFRPRPFSSHAVNLLLDRSPDPSFPSDHTVFAFSIVAVVWLYSKRAGWPLLVAGMLLGLSRVFCGTHYPLDIAGGIALGFAAGLAAWRLRAVLEPLLRSIIGIARGLRLARALPE